MFYCYKPLIQKCGFWHCFTKINVIESPSQLPPRCFAAIGEGWPIWPMASDDGWIMLGDIHTVLSNIGYHWMNIIQHAGWFTECEIHYSLIGKFLKKTPIDYLFWGKGTKKSLGTSVSGHEKLFSGCKERLFGRLDAPLSCSARFKDLTVGTWFHITGFNLFLPQQKWCKMVQNG